MLVVSWPDVDQADDAAHGLGVVHLEGVVQGEGVDVDDAGLEADVGQQRQLVLHQLALGGHQEHGHLEPFRLGIQDLEIELHVVHVERHVLLGLPADHLAGLGLFHPVHGDLLDDHVPAADGADDLLGLDAGGGHEPLDGLGHDGRVHDLALDDGVVHHRGERDLGQDRPARGVRDRDELDEAAADVEADRRRIAPEESHTMSAC